MAKFLFLLAFAFFAGKCSSKALPIKWQIGYMANAVAGGMIFYYAPLVYAAFSILCTCIIAGFFAWAGPASKNKEQNSIFKINFILQTLFFWPINFYDLFYLSYNMKPDNNDV